MGRRNKSGDDSFAGRPGIPANPMSRQRLDKWLWHARVAKTRSLAQGLVEAGHVRLNRVKVTKPGHDVTAGDVLTISVGQRLLVLKVVAFAERRGDYPEARQLYQDLTKPRNAPAQIAGASQPGNC